MFNTDGLRMGLKDIRHIWEYVFILVDITVLTLCVLLNTLCSFKNDHECVLLNQIKFITVLYW